MARGSNARNGRTARSEIGGGEELARIRYEERSRNLGLAVSDGFRQYKQAIKAESDDETLDAIYDVVQTSMEPMEPVGEDSPNGKAIYFPRGKDGKRVAALEGVWYEGPRDTEIKIGKETFVVRHDPYKRFDNKDATYYEEAGKIISIKKKG